MSGTSSYNNEKVVQGEVEYPASDPASGAFFQPDYKKNEDLKLMLDGSKDSLKLEAMKRIIGMIAKGRDASDLFPAVVKNVVSKNLEVKKLVYVYLVRYAEEQQDLALLSISTFQRALKDPNQLIRASALRVLSSIRVPMIVPIVMLAIRDSASDMSPYVRKTAAHAIPKLYSLDPDQKEELVAIIDKLLSDKAPLVVGSAAMAFNEVCGDRMNLIHKSYRKLCLLLADVDEWGQLALLNVLTYYAKTCFPDPNKEERAGEGEEAFYSSGSESPRPPSPGAAPDLRLLLRAARPLLQSRNAGVVLAVARLHHHCGPVQEMVPVAKAMVRLLRAPSEVQSVVLNTIASLTATRPSTFEPFLKSFFVRSSDQTHIKLLKLEILTNLATETNAGAVLREYQTYVGSSDRALAAATVRAIGRLAGSVHSETETCLSGLLHLLSSKDVCLCRARGVRGGGGGEARGVRRRGVCASRGQPRRTAAALRPFGGRGPRGRPVAGGRARRPAPARRRRARPYGRRLRGPGRAGEAAAAVAGGEAVPDAAGHAARVSVRAVSGALRRQLRRARPRAAAAGLRAGTHGGRAPVRKGGVLSGQAQAQRADQQQGAHAYTVGSLSQYIGSCAHGYRPLPPAPDTDTSAALRDAPVADPEPEREQEVQKNKSFYSSPGSSSSSESDSEESSDEEEAVDAEKKQEKTNDTNNYKSSSSSSSDSESDSDSSSESDSESESESDGKEEEEGKDVKKDSEPAPEVKQKSDKSNLELLLELDEVANSLPTMTPTCGGFLSPTTPLPDNEDDVITPVGPSLVPSGEVELVSRVRWAGLEARRRWLRAPHLYSERMVALQIRLTNHSDTPAEDVRVIKEPGSQSIHEFPPVPLLPTGGSVLVQLGLDFGDTIHPIHFKLTSSFGTVSASVSPSVGELVRAVRMTPVGWDARRRALRGLTECTKQVDNQDDEQTICRRVFEAANLAAITSTGNFLRFAGRSMSSRSLVLLCVSRAGPQCAVSASCGNMALANLLAAHVAAALHAPA